MRNLDIKERYIFSESLWFTNSYWPSHQIDHGRKSTDSTGSPFDSSIVEHGESIPYAEAIKAIEKLQEFTNPWDKLNCINESFNRIKTTVVDHYKGKFEIETMDDILPIFIYVISQSQVSHIVSEIQFLMDFLKILDEGYELEQWMLSTIEGAVLYISKDWDLSNPKKEIEVEKALS